MAVDQKLGDNHNYKNNNKGVNNMKNVKTLIVVALMGASLFASTTRTDALGGAGFWAEDYANIASFPADVNNHNVAWTDGTDFTSIFNANGTTWGFTGGTDNDVVNMMWGNGSMGVTFGLNMDPTEAVAATMTCDDGAGNMTATCDDAVAAGETNFAVGFGMPLAGMDFGFTYDGDNVGVNLRRAQNVWLWDTMLINFGMAMEDLDGGAAAGMGFGAACYSNTSYDSGTNGLFALGFGFSDDGIMPYAGADGKMTSEDTKTCGDGTESCDPAATIGIDWNFGVESAMTDWATLRVGYSHGYNFAGDADVTGGADGGGFTIGLGFNYGSFNLDMALANGMIFNDPVKYMTGRNDGALGAGWTISYAW